MSALMSNVPAWFERKFEFSFPVEQYPNLIIRLRGTPARLEEIVEDAAHDRLIKKPEGKWSAQEHAGHLLDLEPLWMARVEDFLSGRDQLSVADLQNRTTDDANHNARSLESLLSEFRTGRVALVDRMATIDATLFSRTLVHPRLKTPMRLVDHLFFVAEHDDHHLARIWELIQT